MNHIALTLSGLLLISAPSAAPQDFVGTYRGSVWTNGRDSPSTTELKLDQDLALSGEYSYEDQDGQIRTGSLDICSIEAQVVTCRWQETLGSGLLRMEFDPSFCTFQGQWATTIVSKAWFYWNGSKDCTTEANADVILTHRS